MSQKLKQAFTSPYIIVFLIHLVIILAWSWFIWFSKSGHVVYVDVTEGIELQNSFEKYFYGFETNWGDATAEKQRIVIVLPLITVFKIFKFAAENYIPLKFIYLYVLSLCALLFSIRLIVGDNLQESKTKLIAALFLSSALYLYNPWFANRLMHFGLFYSTFTIPIAFALSYRYFDSRGISYKTLLLLSLVLGFFTTTPHTFLIYTCVVLPILIYYVLVNRKYKQFLYYVLVVPFLTIIYGSFWILPFFSTTPAPDRVESFDVLNLLAKNATILNNILLRGYWWPSLPEYTFGLKGFFSSVVNVFYLVPFVLLVFFVFSNAKTKIKAVFLGIFAVGLLLSSLTFVSFPLYRFLLTNPFLGNFFWLFRETEKLAYLVSFAYSYILFLVIMYSKKTVYKGALLITVLYITVVGFYSFSLLSTNLKKTQVPNSYYEANELLSKDLASYNVMVFPRVQYTTWANIDSSNYFSNMSLTRDSIPMLEQDSRTNYYMGYLLSTDNISAIDLPNELSRFGIKYLVIRKDSMYYDSSELVESLDNVVGLKIVFDSGELKIYRNNVFTSLSQNPNIEIVTNLGLDALKNTGLSGFSGQEFVLSYTDLVGQVDMANKYFLLDSEGTFDLAIKEFADKFVFPADFVYRTDPHPYFAKMSLTNKNHAESSFYFNNNELKNIQFNFGEEVLFSMGGSAVKSNAKLKFNKSLPVSFAGVQKTTRVGRNSYNINIDSSNTDIAKTNLINVSDISALYINADVSSITYVLNPHISITYIDSNGQILSEVGFYPSQNYQIHSASMVPVNAVSAVINFKTFKTVDSQQQAFKYFYVKDISNNFTNPTANFSYKTDCTQNCAAYIRVLKSPKGGRIKLNLNNRDHVIVTASSANKYIWEEIKLDYLSKNKQVVQLENIEGINSVATFAILSTPQVNSAVTDVSSKVSNMPDQVNFNNVSKLYYNQSLVQENYTNSVSSNIVRKDNDVSYSLVSDKKTNDSIVTFAKPYGPNWLLDNKPPQITHGFINGYSSVENLNPVVTYKTQKYYVYGLIISLFGFIFITPLVFFSTPKDTSV